MKTIKLMISQAVSLHTRLLSLCCAALCAAVANAATFTDVLEVSYEGGQVDAKRSFSGDPLYDSPRPSWIGFIAKIHLGGSLTLQFDVKKNNTTSSREWTCPVTLGADTWQITIKQDGIPPAPGFGFVLANQLKNYSAIKDWPAGVFLCNNSPVEVSRFKVGSKPTLWFAWHNIGNVPIENMPYRIDISDFATGKILTSTSAELQGVVAPGQCAYKTDFGLTLGAVGTYNVTLTLDPDNTKGLKDRSETTRGLYGICVYDDPVPSVGSVVTGNFPYGAYSVSTIVGFSKLTEGNFDMENYPYTFIDKNIVDAEKTSGSGVDKFWCAQLADVNLLTYGGYAKAAGFDNEDALADYLRKNPKVAEGDVISHVLAKGGYNAENARVFLPTDYSTGALTAAFKKYFANGKSFASVGLLFANSQEDAVIHVVTVCGYAVDPTVPETDPMHLTGIYYIDSDDDKSGNPAGSPNSMKFCDLCWDPEARAYFAMREYSWEGVDYFGGLLYCDGESLGYFLSADLAPSPTDLPNYAFYKIAGFPNGAFLTDSPTATVEKTTFVKGEPVYVRFCVGNFGTGEATDGETTDFVIDSDEPVTAKADDVLKAGKARTSLTTIGTEKMSVGKHTVLVVINNEMTHAETSYDDNVAKLSFELIDPVVPTYTVAFDGNGGVGTIAAQTFKCGEIGALPANAFVRGGYDFMGWAKTADGAVAYADKAEVKDIGGQGTTVTLYAVWKLISNPDALPNFGFYKPEGFPDSVFLTDSPTSLIPKSSFAKGETVYIRFCVGNFGKGVAATGEMTSVIVDEDVPVDAVAQDVLVAGGGRISVVNIGTEKMSVGSHRVTLVVNNEQTIDETSYDDNVKVVTFDLVDSAVPTYVVAFDANGGEGTMAPQTLSCGVDGILSGNAFTRSGYEFAGWATSAAGDVAYADQAAVKDLAKANDKVVLYAVWKDAQQSKFTVWAEQPAGAYTGSVTFDGRYALSSKGLPDWVKSVLVTVGASKYSLDASVKWTLNVPIAGVADITVNVTSNESMTARTADWTIAGTDGTPDLVVTLAQEGYGKVTSYKITYLETKGQGNANPSSYTRDDEIVFKPLPDTVKYRFIGWSPSSIAKGSAGDVTVTALWEEKKPDPLPDDDILDTSVANVLDGSVYNDDYALVGTVQIKTAKADKKSRLSKVTATITILGQSKATITGAFDASNHVFEGKDNSGKLLSLLIWENDFTGEYGDYIIEGSRNVFSSKKDADQRSANEALAVCQGTYALTFAEEDGWSALSASVDKKGKVKVSGTLANGAKVAATSQLVVGPDSVLAPIVVSKKNLQFAFGLSFYDDGVEVAGLDEAFCEPVGDLADGLCFYADDVEFLFPDDVEVLGDFLPSGTEIKLDGKKWIVSPDENGKAMKAGKVAWDKKEEDVNWDKSKIEGYNVSNLKLSYTAKTGLFKGSFKVYSVENGQKLKTTTFTVNGIVVGGQGYGTASAKKVGSVPVTIE